ncbi:hypothetical protein VVR12_06625 [Rothia sp. LK2588]|uniref:hypothetical protein n=1 Tax=Rothia sp. LK2588 TaxID=3114369 RepID=UPI0034CF6FE5
MKRHRSHHTLPAVDMRVLFASASGAAAIVCGSLISGITPAHTDAGSPEQQSTTSQHAPIQDDAAGATTEAPQE